ncbi:MAG: hypothetical protein ABJA57_10325 [Ginsengibacter sp.]
MKRPGVIFAVLFLAIFSLWQSGKQHKRKNKNIDEEGKIDKGITGPRGERIFIGAGGGRYFTNDERKIYVGYKKKKADRNT